MNPIEVLDILKTELPKPVIIGALKAFRDEMVRVRPEPDVIIGGKETPYMLRWWAIPRRKYDFNVYLHKFVRSDDDRALHDHPADNISILFDGEYIEHVPMFSQDPAGKTIKIHRVAGDVVARSANAMHRVELLPEEINFEDEVPDYRLKPCWSLFLTGPKIREWGFACKRGWIPWQEFTGQSEDNGPVTDARALHGCGEDDT